MGALNRMKEKDARNDLNVSIEQFFSSIRDDDASDDKYWSESFLNKIILEEISIALNKVLSMTVIPSINGVRQSDGMAQCLHFVYSNNVNI